MRLIKSAADERYDRIYRARIDCVWLNGDLEKSDVVVDELAVIGRRGDTLTLDRETTTTNGLRHVDKGLVAAEFSGTIGDALLRLYRKFLARIEAACSNDDVIDGRISEQAAVLNGLT